MDNQIATTAEAVEADALPRRYEVHADPSSRKPGDQAMPKAVTNQPVAKKSPAQWAYERVAMYLKNFEEQLDADHEMAMGFTGADAGILRIEGMGYFDPDIVTFYGSDPAGGRTQLVQHVSQLNVMLRALPKEKEDAEPRRIGFRLVRALEEEDATS